MQKLSFISLFVWVAISIISCKKDEKSPTEYVSNGNIEEGMSSWAFRYDDANPTNPNQYTFGYTNEFAASPKNSLKANCLQIKTTNAFGYFVQQIATNNFKKGQKLTLKAKIKGVNLTGKGVSLALRGDKSGQVNSVFFKSTQDSQSITGNFDFKEYTVSLDSYAGDADYILIFLVYLPETTGSVYFDDISVTSR